MKKLLSAVSLCVLLLSGASFAFAQTTNTNCLNLTYDMGVGATDATTGGQVTLLQNFLQTKGLLEKLTADNGLGSFGRKTENAVKSFQERNGIRASGYVGPLTRANIQTLTCAIGTAPIPTIPSSVPTGSSALLTFTAPVSGAVLVKGEKDIAVDWTLASGVLTTFSTGSTTAYLTLDLIDSTGASIGQIGQDIKLSQYGDGHRIEGAFRRNAIQNRDNSIPSGQYKLKATLRYVPKSSSPAELALVASANTYVSESGWFSIVNAAPKPVVQITASNKELTTGGPVTLSWTVSAGATNCFFYDGITRATTSVTTSGSKTVTVARTTAFAVTCDLTSAWPYAGMSYTTNGTDFLQVKVGEAATDPYKTVSGTISSTSVLGSQLTLQGTVASAATYGFAITNASGTKVYDSVSFPTAGAYSKTFSLTGFTPNAFTNPGVYRATLIAPYGSGNVVATSSFTVPVPTTCSSAQTTNGCVPTPTCNSEQHLENGQCVNNTRAYTCTNGAIVQVPLSAVNDSSLERMYCGSVASFITSEELARGWYYGTANSKKSGTPSSWTFISVSGWQSMWRAPLTINSTLGENVTTTFGGTVSGRWDVTPTDGNLSCVAAGGLLPPGIPVNGSGAWATPQLYTTTQYGMRCTNSFGQVATKYVTVNVPTQQTTGGPAVTLTSNKTTVNAGETATLTLSVSPTTGVTCGAAGGSVPVGTIVTSGSWTTPPLYTTTQYGVRCVGPGGDTYKYVTVTVNPVSVSKPVLTLTANGTNVTNNSTIRIAQGGNLMVSWNATGSPDPSCTLNGVSSSRSGTQTYTSLTSGGGSYTLSCSSLGGTTALTFNVELATVTSSPSVTTKPSITLKANGNRVTSGESVRAPSGTLALEWGVTGAESCTLNGAVVATTGANVLSGIQSGSYTLSCTNGAGTTNLPFAVTVTNSTTAPSTINKPTITIKINGSKINEGDIVRSSTGTIRAEWGSTGATSCTLNGVAFEASGAKTFSGLTSASYTFSCTNSAGTTSLHYSLVVPTVLGASATRECVDTAFNFHRGYEGVVVSKLQNFLIAGGFMDGVATGFYGDATVTAVKSYQSSKDLPETGMVFDFTRAAIKADSCN